MSESSRGLRAGHERQFNLKEVSLGGVLWVGSEGGDVASEELPHAFSLLGRKASIAPTPPRTTPCSQGDQA